MSGTQRSRILHIRERPTMMRAPHKVRFDGDEATVSPDRCDLPFLHGCDEALCGVSLPRSDVTCPEEMMVWSSHLVE
jgi:hypothetical protein